MEHWIRLFSRAARSTHALGDLRRIRFKPTVQGCCEHGAHFVLHDAAGVGGAVSEVRDAQFDVADLGPELLQRAASDGLFDVLPRTGMAAEAVGPYPRPSLLSQCPPRDEQSTVRPNDVTGECQVQRGICCMDVGLRHYTHWRAVVREVLLVPCLPIFGRSFMKTQLPIPSANIYARAARIQGQNTRYPQNQ